MKFVCAAFKAAFFCLVFLMSFLIFVPEVYASEEIWVKVTSPNGGETLKVGDTYTITWDSSPNVDMITIGYSFGPGSLNWISYNQTNTKSYSWKINVGNTINTQVKIEVIGYWVGHGSSSDQSDNYFTVLQPPSPTPIPKPTYVAPTISQHNSNFILPTSAPPRINSIVNSPITVSQIIVNNTQIINIYISQIFYFAGSKTTPFKSLENPKKVENFTLDTPSGFRLVFADPIDLTNSNTRKSLENIDKYWSVTDNSFNLKEEWWSKYAYKGKLKAVYKNDQLTNTNPKVLGEDSGGNTTEKNVSRLNEHEIEFAVNKGEKVVVEPKITIEGDDVIKETKPNHIFTVQTSQHNLLFFVKQNGKFIPLTLNNIDQDKGIYQIEVSDFVKGNNELEFFYKENSEAGEKFITKRIVVYTPTVLGELSNLSVKMIISIIISKIVSYFV